MLMILNMLNLLFMNSKNPLILGLILILQTMFMALFIGKLNLTFFLSFIIFLIFIGGMLILFMYVISLTFNNKMMNFNYYYLLILLIILTNTKYNNNYETIIFSNMITLNDEATMNLLKLYNMPNLIINLMLIVYLFIMMIITSKITYFYLGPFYKFQ